MKNSYFTSKSNNQFCGYFLQIFLLLGIALTTNAQVRVPFTQRTSQYTPGTKIYNVKGDFTIMGNTNLTLQNYGDQTANSNNSMIYVDVDGNSNNGVDGKPTFNSSRSTLALSTENGANPACSNIIYAGLYWTGRSSDGSTSDNSFNVTKNNVTKTFDKRNISLKGPNASSYTQFTAAATDIYYPTTSDGFMYSAYKEVTDYVRANGVGEYTAADIAVVEGNGGSTGFYGGWSLIVVYENSKMKYRDVTIFDGHAYVTGGTASFEIPVSGFNTVQSGPVGVKLGLMAGEGDNGIPGDYFQIKRQSDNAFVNLSHAGNSTGNFFNSSIQTGGNSRNPNLLNNTGLDISMFNINNPNNTVLGNNQTATTFKYGSTQDTYVIFAIAMAVDAYIPEIENILTATTINNVPVTTEPYTSLPGQDVGFNIDIKNLGTEAINNYKVIVPIPYNASYVAGSAVGTILFSPAPTPNNVTFDPTLGATGSIVWDMGTLPLPANPSILLAKLSFKLKTTTNCSILLNATCGSPIYVSANSGGTGAITGITFSGTRAIKGYTQNGACTGQPISETLAIRINGAAYVAANCQNTPLIRNFGYCSAASTIGTSAIAANFPPGSTFYNQFPITINTIQYSDANPIPLVAGSTITYYAVPPGTTGCVFPFTVSKCKLIVAQNDNLGPINGTTGSTNAGNIFNNNGSGIDTLGGVQVQLSQVNLTVLTPATPINGGPIPAIDLLTGNVVIPVGTPAGTYTITYEICEKTTPTNCDPAVVTITVTAPQILAQADVYANINCANVGIVGNVLLNDLLNGSAPTIGLVNFTLLTGSNPNITISNTGNVVVSSGIAAGTYNFTYRICQILNPGNCSTASITVTISANQTTPVFTLPDNICAGTAAPVLPTTSNNGIAGTWNPATVSNTASGTYTFTPGAGQCANQPIIKTITVNAIAATFNPIAPICAGAAAPVLPTTSTNGVTGTWSPATVSNTATGTYTFTPAAGQCATGTTTNLTVTVNAIAATFNPIAPICAGAAAPVLPTTSTNGVTGTWSPATVSNTATATYTFTPAAGQCATGTTTNLTVTVNATAATFNPIAPICAGTAAPVLPNTSTNGVTGTWSPATVSNTATGTYTFTPAAGQCATGTTTNLTVTVNATAATFNPIAPICAGAAAPVLPTTSTNGVTGTWSPATVSNTATGTYTFTPAAGQCATGTTTNLTVTVNATSATFNPIAPICAGAAAPVLPTTSTNGVTGTWSPATVSNTATGTYTFTPAAGQCATTTTQLTVTVNQLVPTFLNLDTEICSGDAAPILPLTSSNGIAGTWSPATVDNTATATYTFTPDAGQCATAPFPVTITVNQLVPTFLNLDTEICRGDAAPVLPLTSSNGITGTWSPATVDNTATAIYTFTPDAGQCATAPFPVTITVNQLVPTFLNLDTEICRGDAAPILPLTSSNGITGTWSPATVDNTATATYTFTPDAGQCATAPFDVVITVNQLVPTFLNLDTEICRGDAAPILPLTSSNGITGTWSPATVDNTATATYTFTPDAGQCATAPFPVTITVNQLVPTFLNLDTEICRGDAAPVLPLTSSNGITGTWSPATVDNTATATYTFTPDAGQCATAPFPVTITVNQLVPTFLNLDTEICRGDAAPILPLTSSNGITGTWSPATVDNTATATYTFTPDAGQCATAPFDVVITVNQLIPTFLNLDTEICRGDAAPILPLTSSNGITGTWSPATVDNTATATYTFTPDAGQCATAPFDVVITVNQLIPTFLNLDTEICRGDAAPILPLTSSNGITGTWSPAAVDNTATATYTFTPDAGQCATAPFPVTITVNQLVPTFLNLDTEICRGDAAPVLPLTSSNGITGTWSPATVDNTATATYTFTPDAGQCATAPFPVTITVNQLVPTFLNLDTEICSGDAAPILPLTSSNGITGTWSPATVDNTATATYTFTPDAGQCATAPFDVVITVNQLVPTFLNLDTEICRGDAAPILPLTSSNGITGTWSPATVDNTATATYTFTPDAGQCATAPFDVVITVNQLVPTFLNLDTEICRGDAAPILPLTSSNGITGTWSPATVDNTATATYTFTPDAGQCATAPFPVTITVNQLVPTFLNLDTEICSGDAAPILPLTSSNGITGTWSPATVDNTATATYTFTPDAGQCATAPFDVVITVNQLVPTFLNLDTEICRGDAAPILPLTSSNGITGTWSPATVDNTATATYTFTPDAGQCATAPFPVTITVNQLVPTFLNLDTEICRGDAAPVLPLTSSNGITGTWSPATVDNTATATYTFTPDAGQCATAPFPVTITVNQLIPTFLNLNTEICSGDAAPILPLTSSNGITGTWSPATVDNTATATYTFTPDAGQCATAPFPVTITVNQLVPTFLNLDTEICRGDAAPILPLTSSNGITGTWSPVTVDNTATATYTFTPDAGQCATAPFPVTITVNQLVPTFLNLDTEICRGDAAPVLPLTSSNGITGTWSPATVDNTATATYTFTPDSGQCATAPFPVTITVNQLVPTFLNLDTEICSGDAAPILPLTSSNGITGTWSPATVDNTATATYTFTPDAGQCATAPFPVTITVNQLVPTFLNLDTEICRGDAAPILPSTSSNGITGTWSPATVDNTATATYTFTPDAGQCATAPFPVTITVNQLVPTFLNLDTEICSGDAAPILPLTSSNGITGTWSPATVDNTATATYTFTPDAGQCATAPFPVTITVNQLVPTFLNLDTEICRGDAAPILPLTSSNGITGTWSPATVDNTATATYTFTPDAGQCATAPFPVTITVNQLVPTFLNLDTEICRGDAAPILPLTSSNGITGTWSPATVDNTVTATYTFTPDAGQCATAPFDVVITVNQLVPTFLNLDTEICRGDAAPVLPLTSSNGITGTWSPATVDNTATATYTFTPDAGQCATAPFDVVITVNQLVPTFLNLDTEICRGDAAPILPLTSSNGITGTWSPATVDNTATATYTFTPDTGQCATAPFDVVITVNQLVPTFLNLDTEICRGDAAPILPLTSSNGITGTWSPATVDNTATATYTFTPDTGQCATAPFDVVITVNQLVPTFLNLDTEICRGDAAPILPLTSSNGITGTWSPATVDNTATATYTFTPDAGQCATAPFDIVITVNQLVPTFLNLDTEICRGDAAPILPLTSSNGITGTWSPATVDNTATATYTFTPTAGQCATAPFPVTITVNQLVATFAPLTPICLGDTAPTLPLTSSNGITGTWNPATISNTNSGTYTFTPDAGQCATQSVSINFTVNQLVAAFSFDNNICAGDVAPILPLTSNNGINGTWNPTTISNTTSGNYTFTPDAGQCATQPVSVFVTINQLVASFDPIAPICAGDAVPTLSLVSLNGINGTWNPATIDNTASGTYTFTPNAGQCATATVSLAVVVSVASTPVVGTIVQTTCTTTTGSVVLSGLPQGSWTINPGNITGNTTSVTINNLIPDTYNFTVTNGLGCTSAAASVTIDAQPVYPVEVVNRADADCNNDNVVTFDLNNYLPATIPGNGAWTDVDNTGGLIGSEFSPYLVNVGVYTFRYEVVDAGGCQRVAEIRMTVDDICPVAAACPLLNSQPEKDIHNGFSPNGDEFNEEFIIDRIDQLDCFPTNSVEIYNRWGVLVYETKQYDNRARVFKGVSEGRTTVDKSSKLPSGTYYYVINYTDKEGNNHHLEGYVYLTR